MSQIAVLLNFELKVLEIELIINYLLVKIVLSIKLVKLIPRLVEPQKIYMKAKFYKNSLTVKI